MRVPEYEYALNQVDACPEYEYHSPSIETQSIRPQPSRANPARKPSSFSFAPLRLSEKRGISPFLRSWIISALSEQSFLCLSVAQRACREFPVYGRKRVFQIELLDLDF